MAEEKTCQQTMLLIRKHILKMWLIITRKSSLCHAMSDLIACNWDKKIRLFKCSFRECCIFYLSFIWFPMISKLCLVYGDLQPENYMYCWRMWRDDVERIELVIIAGEVELVYSLLLPSPSGTDLCLCVVYRKCSLQFSERKDSVPGTVV